MEPRGWRAIPPALLLALATTMMFSIVRTVFFLTSPLEDWYSPRFILVGEGTGFAWVVLALVGSYELARRETGRAAKGMLLATSALAMAVALDVTWGLAQFSTMSAGNTTLHHVYDWLMWLSWTAVPIGFALAVPARHRWLAIVAVAVSSCAFLPPPMRHLPGKLLGFERTGMVLLDLVLRLARVGAWLALLLVAARGTTAVDRHAAARGFRLAGRALWLRVIAALAMVCVMLTMLGSRGGGGGGLKLAMLGQGVVSVIALAMLGWGALRAARAGVTELGRWTLVLGGGAALWVAGVALAQLPAIYRMFEGDSWSRHDATVWVEALAVASPLAVILAVALVASAVSGYAARRGDPDLQGTATGHSLGFVALMLAALALQTWMLPAARSAGSVVALLLFAAIASLWATVMMARLFDRAATVLEDDPALPTASVVSGRT
jgi:hypothetical protein